MSRSLPSCKSESVGIDGHGLLEAWRVVECGAARGAFAGAVALVAKDGKIVLHRACGYSMIIPLRKRMRPDSIFDLASITKVVATTTSILILIEKGLISLDTRVSSIISPFSGGKENQTEWKDAITVRHLLTHTSGLPSWYEFYTKVSNERDLFDVLYRIPLSAAPGIRFEYSDVGFILLGKIVELVSGLNLANYAKKNIFAPLKMTDTCFKPPASKLGRIVATEYSNWRRRLVQGEVHDENAHAMGGVGGHAGLFSTAGDLSLFCQCLVDGTLDNHRLLSDDTLRLMRTSQTAKVSGYVGLGWRVKTDATPGVANNLSASAFGHSGYTGTSIWLDPENRLTMILLTNRVHPIREGDPTSDKSVGIMMKRKVSWNSVNSDFQRAVMSSLKNQF